MEEGQRDKEPLDVLLSDGDNETVLHPDPVELIVNDIVEEPQELADGVADTLVLTELVKVPLPLPD